MKWLGNNIIQLITCGLLLWIVLKPKDQSVDQYRLSLLQQENRLLKGEHDSLIKVLETPVPQPDSLIYLRSDSIIQVNTKTIHELAKKNAAHIDTAGSAELRRIFAGY